MHSSRIRTAHLLTVSQHALLGGMYLPGVCTYMEGVPAWGVYLPRGVPGQGIPGQGMYLAEGCTCLGEYLPGGTYPGGVTAQGGIYPGGTYGGYLPRYSPL